MNDDINDDIDENLDDNLSGDDDSSSFDDFEQQNTLGDLWRNNPMVKIGIILAAGIAIFGTIILFGGSEEELSPSYVGPGSELTTPPGTVEASPDYVKRIEELNKATVEDAVNTGKSALPVPIEPPIGRLPIPQEEEEVEDPLQRWRRLQEERLSREMQQREIVEPVESPDMSLRTEAIEALADLMEQQMQTILESKNTETVLNSLQITDPAILEEEDEEEGLENEEFGDDEDFDEDEEGLILLPAGTVEYAQLLIEANSDAPGPVMAQIASGPLKGARILGNFEVQERRDVLTLNFDTAVIDGVSYSIEAVALDPETTLPGLATDVDHHYLQRVALPMAAAFIEGFTEAIAQTDQTVIVVQGGTSTQDTTEPDSGEEVALGIQEAGEELRDILDETADDLETTIVIESGTPLGVLFLEPVREDDEDT